jgi:hypothetical protein
MIKRLPIYAIALVMLFAACDQEKEIPILELEKDFQPLEIGDFWIYEVDETIYFGENDSEEDQFFIRDRVRTSYLNAENEVTYVLERSKSSDRRNWNPALEYTMIHRDRLLIRTINNVPIVPLVFPPAIGKVWNGRAYQVGGNDEFEIEQAEPATFPGFEAVERVRINQENSDDEITARDIRYEVFGKGVGLLEKYDEVLTYCSRNNCLGQQLITSGSKTHLKLLEYGSN